MSYVFNNIFAEPFDLFNFFTTHNNLRTHFDFTQTNSLIIFSSLSVKTDLISQIAVKFLLKILFKTKFGLLTCFL